MKLTRCIAAILAAALVSAPLPAPAAEHKVLIPASKLLPWEKLQRDRHTILFVQGKPGIVAFFYAPLRLPAGAKISGLSYRHYGADASAHTVVGIDRVRAGETPAWRRIYQAASTAWAPPPTAAITVTGAAIAGEERKVKKGWTYFVMVSADNQYSTVLDVTVKYQDP